MNSALYLALGGLAVLLVLYLVARFVTVKQVRPLARQAILKQPDSISLARIDDPQWTNGAAIDALTRSLLDVGFVELGSYTVDKMPGVIVRMLMKGDESVAAHVYDHPRAGAWVELVTRYEDGSSMTASSMPDTGLARPPWLKTIRRTGAPPDDLYRELLRERPTGAMKEVSAPTMTRDFEQGYVAYMMWRKNNDLSAGEIMNLVAKHHAAGR